MKLPSFDFVQAAAVRRAVVPAGDIREDIAFQNDINGLLARFDAKTPPLTALGWIQEPVALASVPASVPPHADVPLARRAMRALQGGLRFSAMNDVSEPHLSLSTVAPAHAAAGVGFPMAASSRRA